MNKSTLVPREEISDLDWLARNVHVWPCGKHQPWCYVVTKIDGERTWASNVLSRSFPYSLVDKDQWLARRAELQNKPSWETHEYKVIAQGRNGSWYGSNYSEEKFCHESSFCITGTGWNCICRGVDLGDWRDTLEKRPEQDEFEPFVSIEDSQEKEMKQDNKWFERGELPPVGTECEIDLGAKWRKAFVVGRNYTGRIVVEIDTCDFIVADGCTFRPIRTEREKLIEIISSSLLVTTEQVADAIIAAGFKLEAK